MEAAQPSAPDQTERSRVSERKCLVTGEVQPKEKLIRFVVSPDQTVVADLSQNLPGRGLWVTADRACIEAAARKNLFSKAAKESVKADADLADQVAELLKKRALNLLGLARRAGVAVLGQEQVEKALKSGKIWMLLLATDATQGVGNRKAVPEYRSLTRDELGAALGHDQTVYAGLKYHPLAQKLALELERMAKIAPVTYISSQTDSEIK